MSASVKRPVKMPSGMTVREFLEWDSEDGRTWQLVDGIPQAMAPAKRWHGAIQGEIVRLLGNHLIDIGSPCTVVTAGGVVPRVLSEHNFRIPDVLVTCSADTGNDAVIEDPVLIIEVISPSNRRETWTNVWAYVSIPSVQEILVVHSLAISAELLRRDADGNWPALATVIDDSALDLASIGYRAPLRAFYRTTALGRSG